MKKLAKKLLLKLYNIFTCKLPNMYYLIFYSHKIQKIITRKHHVTDVRIFNFKYWHLGYIYYIGFMGTKKVIIKYNFDDGIICHEINNIEYLIKNSEILKNKIPTLIAYGKIGKGAYMIEEYLNYNNFNYLKGTTFNYKKIFGELINIIEEFQKIGFMHLDLDLNNLFYDEKFNVYMIDFGFSMRKGDFDFSFVKSKKKIKYILAHLNQYSRLERMCIDDAISMLNICTDIYNGFISDYCLEWKKINDLSNKLVFNYQEKKNEN